MTGQSRQSGLAVVNDEVRQLGVGGARTHHGSRASFLSSLREVVSVRPGARQSDEESPRSHLTGVDDDVGAHLCRAVNRFGPDPWGKGGNVDNSHRV